MRIGKHINCGGELYFGEMNGDGYNHVINFFCGKCKRTISLDKIEELKE